MHSTSNRLVYVCLISPLHLVECLYTIQKPLTQVLFVHFLQFVGRFVRWSHNQMVGFGHRQDEKGHQDIKSPLHSKILRRKERTYVEIGNTGIFQPVHFVRFFYEYIKPGGPLEFDQTLTGCFND